MSHSVRHRGILSLRPMSKHPHKSLSGELCKWAEETYQILSFADHLVKLKQNNSVIVLGNAFVWRLLDHGGNRAPLLPSTEILFLPFKTAENNNKDESQQDCRTSWQCFKSLPLWLGHAEFRLQTTVHVSHDNRGVKPHLIFHRRGR